MSSQLYFWNATPSRRLGAQLIVVNGEVVGVHGQQVSTKSLLLVLDFDRVSSEQGICQRTGVIAYCQCQWVVLAFERFAEFSKQSKDIFLTDMMLRGLGA